MSTCASCGAPILWAVTGKQHRRIPIDPDPTADGNIELAPLPDSRPYYATTWGTSHTWPDGTPRYRSHFSTCPQASEHRRHR